MSFLTSKSIPYIIAEAGVNHNGSIELAVQMIARAKTAGADCVKFQAFNADELVITNADKADYQKISGPSNETQYEMLKKLELTFDDFSQLKRQADHLNIDLLITPFSSSWVDKIIKLRIPAIKIGSGDNVSEDILLASAQSGLPIIISTGMAGQVEIRNTLAFLVKNGCQEIYPLHCVSNYPAEIEQINLSAIETLKQMTGLPCGFSDHTREIITGALAVAYGAVIIEKHFTLDHQFPGPDQAMSLPPDELASYIQMCRLSAKARGNGNIEPDASELVIKKAARKSIVTTRYITAGMVINRDMITFKRPGTGIPPSQIHNIIGRTANQDIKPDTLITTEMIETSESEIPRHVD